MTPGNLSLIRMTRKIPKNLMRFRFSLMRQSTDHLLCILSLLERSVFEALQAFAGLLEQLLGFGAERGG